MTKPNPAQTKRPFFSITPDIDDEAIARVARAKGVPELSSRTAQPDFTEDRPPDHETAGSGREGGPDGASGSPQAFPATPAAAPAATPKSPSLTARFIPIRAAIPAYAHQALRSRALEQNVSINYLILAALKQSGIPIDDADLIEDGRRLRGSRTS